MPMLIIIEVNIILIRIGSLFNDFGRNEEALSDYNKAIQINPLNAMAYNNRG